ncbi:MAG: leucyl aminopeptidase [Deltaproteobacteria bacterium]|nr:leucyl aminopeptidase [Deltaproteobacteria bacterium]
MKVTLKVGDAAKTPADLLVVNLFEGTTKPGGAAAAIDKATRGQLSAYLKDGDFKGKPNETLLLRPTRGVKARRVLVVGLGKKNRFILDRVRQAAGTAAQAARSLGVTHVVSVLHGVGEDGGGDEDISAAEAAQAIVEGTRLGGYAFSLYKSGKKSDSKPITQLTIVDNDAAKVREIREGARVGSALSDSVVFARDLANRSGSDHPPKYLADEARKMAREVGLRCTIWGPRELARAKMGALLGVARGSRNEPRLIVLEYRCNTKGAQTVCVVGKGITFDSGGISLKPPGKMDEMKFDMSGGAATIALARAMALLKPDVNVVCIVPSAENLPGGNAYKPGDILTSAAGVTIEVLNTDAEGRIVLADGLHHALSFKPDAIVDMATLTGACVVALGSHASGLMTNNAALADRIKASGEATYERVWELPMFEEYADAVKSEVADIKNIGNAGEAGTIAGASFLQKFVGKTPWVHLDIAGTAWTMKKKPYAPRGATGVGVRLLAHTLLNWAPLVHDKADDDDDDAPRRRKPRTRGKGRSNGRLAGRGHATGRRGGR